MYKTQSRMFVTIAMGVLPGEFIELLDECLAVVPTDTLHRALEIAGER